MQPRFLTALPVFNEEPHIADVLDRVRQYCTEILVIDDGSTDRTPSMLKEQSDIQVITHEINTGYGAALRSAFRFASEQAYDVLVTIDCDGQHEPCLIPDLVAAVYPSDQEPFDFVSGSRYLRPFPGDSRPPEERRRINFAITETLNQHLGFNLTDAFCGFKAFRVWALEQLEITELGYAMPLQLWVQAARAGFRIVEFPVPLVYLEEERSFGGSLDDARRRMAYYQEVLDRELEAAPRSSVQNGCQR